MADRSPAAGQARLSSGVGRYAPILLGCMLSAAACRPDDSTPVATDVIREGVDMVLEGMDAFLTREGVRRARLRADTAEFVAEGEVHMRPVQLTFYDVDGQEASAITADSGVFHEDTEDMEAWGSILVLDRRQDRRLETEQLRYIAAEDRLHGDTAFTLWRDQGRTVLRGAAFESDPGLDSVRVVSPSGASEGVPSPVPARAAASPDSVRTPPDSSAAPAGDSTPTPSDTLPPAPDSMESVPDSGSTAPDSGSTEPDSIRTVPGARPRS